MVKRFFSALVMGFLCFSQLSAQEVASKAAPVIEIEQRETVDQDSAPKKTFLAQHKKKIIAALAAVVGAGTIIGGIVLGGIVWPRIDVLVKAEQQVQMERKALEVVNNFYYFDVNAYQPVAEALFSAGMPTAGNGIEFLEGYSVVVPSTLQDPLMQFTRYLQVKNNNMKPDGFATLTDFKKAFKAFLDQDFAKDPQDRNELLGGIIKLDQPA